MNYLNSRNDSFLLEELNEVLAVFGGLLGGFVEQDDTADVFLDVWGGEEEFSVSSGVLRSVFEANGLESLSNSSSRFVSSEDTESRSGDLVCGFHQLLSVVSFLDHFFMYLG